MTLTKFSRLLDNRERGSVGLFLKEHLRAESACSFVSAYFTIYAHAALKDQLNHIDSMKFLFGEPSFIKSLDPERDPAPAFALEGDTMLLADRLHQSRAARECAEWLREKVQVRSIIRPGFLHGKMYHVEEGRDFERAVLGSSNFTVQGLGLSDQPNMELNIEVTDDRDRADLKGWFDALWADDTLTEDVKAEVLRHLERLYVPHSPQFIYYLTLYHLLGGFRADTQADLKQPQHLFESEIWQALFEFQRHGVQAVIRKLEAFGGCILADSVGLGKTYTALAVIKYYQNLNDRVLVLTPKKLRSNWTVYQVQNNSPLNPFMTDRFAYTVLSHTDLSREHGQVGDVDLTSLNWGNYDLVVIDESHNFRNNTKGKRDEQGQVVRKSRYERLLHDIIKSGRPTKVLLLSATPVNNDLGDLRNQLLLMSGGEDGRYADELGVGSLTGVLGRAQKTFERWSQGPQRQTDDLLHSLDSRLFTLLDGLTLARSRAHIRRHYPDTLRELGGFPVRQRPISLATAVDTRGLFPSYDAIHNQILGYTLALFAPSRYLLPEHRAQYVQESTRNFSQAKREGYLVGMMKVNLLKRLESGVTSFALTLERTLSKIRALETQLSAFLSSGTGSVNSPTPDDLDDEEAQDALMVGRNVRYDLRHLDVPRWQRDLNSDREQLEALLETARLVTPARDAKLTEMKGVLQAKLDEPTLSKDGERNRKALVFTAFADTAQYLYRELEGWARERNIHIGLVVGSGDNRATLGRAAFGDILTNFSPRAKRRAALAQLPQDEEIDLLIATDCISEGQNLQDCDLLINYDIHWNPVRLVQRFGRIDRIGSRMERIGMVNFWPTDDLNAYLNLRGRVEARMALVDLTATAQDNPLADRNVSETELESLVETELSYRDQQLLRMRDEVPDLEDLGGSLSLTDFSLDDFRMELSAFLDADRHALESAPNGLFGLVAAGSEALPGILFCLRQLGTAPATSNQANQFNPLHPYFLVYVRADGTVRYGHAQARQTLDLYRAVAAGQDTANQALHDLFDEQTKQGEHMQAQSALLSAALASIRQSVQQKTVQSLFGGRGAVLPKAEDRVTDETPFELITWLAIMDTETEQAKT